MPEQLCGDEKIQGGKFKWVCILEPHGPTEQQARRGEKPRTVDRHVYRAFSR